MTLSLPKNASDQSKLIYERDNLLERVISYHDVMEVEYVVIVDTK